MCLFLTVVICLCYLVIGTQGRKYDIEAEAMKLYGEDSNTVIKRFRRSPEYLSILQDKVAEIQQETEHTLLQITEAFRNKLDENISMTFATDDKNKDEKKPDRRYMRSRFYRGMYPHRRQGENNEEGSSNSTTTLSPVQLLDQFVPEYGLLTVAESNRYKDLGFEYAGYAIHGLIKNTGDSAADSENFSTRMPNDGATSTSATKHSEIHTVTPVGEESTSAKTTEATHTVPPVERLRAKTNRHKKTRHYSPK